MYSVLTIPLKNCTRFGVEMDNSFIKPQLVNLLNVCPSLSPLPMIKQQKNWSVVIAGPDRILGQLLTKEGNLFPIRPGGDYQLISSHNDKVIV